LIGLVALHIIYQHIRIGIASNITS